MVFYVGSKPTVVVVGGNDISQYLLTGSLTDSYASNGGLCPATGSLVFTGPASALDNWVVSGLNRGASISLSIGGNVAPRGDLRVLSSNYTEDDNKLEIEYGCRIAYYQGKQPADVREQSVQNYGTSRTIKAAILEALRLGELITLDSDVVWLASEYSDFSLRGALNPSGGWLKLASELLDSINCYAYCRSDGKLVVREINFDAAVSALDLSVNNNIIKTQKLRGEYPPDILQVNGNWRKIYVNGYTRTFDEGSITGTEYLNPGANPEFEKVTNFWLYGRPNRGAKVSVLTEQKFFSAGNDGLLLSEYKGHKLEPGVVSTPGGGPYTETTEYTYSGDFLVKKVREKINTWFAQGVVNYTFDMLTERDVEEWTKAGASWVYKKTAGRLRQMDYISTVTNPDGTTQVIENTSYWWDVDTETATGTAAQPPAAERRTPVRTAESNSYQYKYKLGNWGGASVGVKSISIPYLPDLSTNTGGANNADGLRDPNATENAPTLVNKYALLYAKRQADVIVGKHLGVQLISSWNGNVDYTPLQPIRYTRIGGSIYLLFADGTSWQFDRLQCLTSYDGLYSAPILIVSRPPTPASISNGTVTFTDNTSEFVTGDIVIVNNGLYYFSSTGPNAGVLYTDSSFSTPATISGNYTVSPAIQADKPTLGLTNESGELLYGFDGTPLLPG